MSKERYLSINGLKALACLLIVFTHVKDNLEIVIGSGRIANVFGYTGNILLLFMSISAFGLCCGYYQRVFDGTMDFTEFYKRRYLKILPFYIVLICIDLVASFSIPSLFEAFANVTLFTGFIPNTISVIGVSWFLGTVFVFYFIFPFFCVLIQTKGRAWFTFVVSIALNLVCSYYFDLSKQNFATSFCFFVLGGLIYKYRETLKKTNIIVKIVFLLLSLVPIYLMPEVNLFWMPLCAALMIIAVSSDTVVLNNKIAGFFSKYSLEIYLSHMAMFQILSKLHVHSLFGNRYLQFGVSYVVVLICATAFAVVFNVVFNKLLSKFKTNKS